MNLMQISTLVVLVALSMVLTNFNAAFAESAKSYDEDRTHTQEKKQTKDSDKMMKKSEHEKKQSKTIELASERMMDKTSTKATETMLMLGARGGPERSDALRMCSAIGPLTFTCRTADADITKGASVEIVSIGKLRGGAPSDGDISRIIYKVTAGDVPLRNAQVVIDSQGSVMKNTVTNLFASQHTVHTVYMNVADPNSVSVRLVK